MESEPIILAQGPTKTFRVRQKRRGIFGGLRGALTGPARQVHAVRDVSLMEPAIDSNIRRSYEGDIDLTRDNTEPA